MRVHLRSLSVAVVSAVVIGVRFAMAPHQLPILTTGEHRMLETAVLRALIDSAYATVFPGYLTTRSMTFSA